MGSKQLVGEAGYSVLERTWARPTLDVHGMPGGFIGAGAKTVIPAKALAKVSMRLVPGMTPAKAFALYKSYVEKIAPAGVDVEVRTDSLGRRVPDSASTTPTSRPRPRALCTRFGARTRSLSAPAAPSPSSATSTAIWACPA